jgi:hypothetical protein
LTAVILIVTESVSVLPPSLRTTESVVLAGGASLLLM